MGIPGYPEIRLIQADTAATDALAHAGALRRIAARVAAGILPRNAAVLVVRREFGRGYPDAVFCFPLEDADAAAWRAGDRSLARDLAEEIEEQAALFLAQIRAGKAN